MKNELTLVNSYVVRGGQRDMAARQCTIRLVLPLLLVIFDGVQGRGYRRRFDGSAQTFEQVVNGLLEACRTGADVPLNGSPALCGGCGMGEVGDKGGAIAKPPLLPGFLACPTVYTKMKQSVHSRNQRQ